MAYRSSQESTAYGKSITIPAPSNVQDNDILLIWAWSLEQNGDQGPFVFPDGFIVKLTHNVGDTRVALAWKRASSESGGYTVSSNSDYIAAQMSVWSGRITSGDPFDATSNIAYTTDNTTVRAAGITINTAGSDLIYCGFSDTDYTAALAEPSGMISRQSTDWADGWMAMETASIDNAPIGATGDKDGTAEMYTTRKHAILLALKPDGGGGPAPTLTSVSPERGYTTGGTSVTLTGEGFTGATGVTFGGTAATNVTVVNDTTITCTTPEKTAGPSKVVVKHGDGDSTDNVFFVRLAAPTLTAEQVGSLIVVRWAGEQPDPFDPDDGTWLWATNYGAAGNGTTDDTSAIQSCVTAAKTAGKGVYLPEGTYKLNSAVNLSSDVVMRGKSVSDSSLISASRAGSSSMLNVSNTDDVEISHLSLVGPGPFDSQIIGVSMTGATGVVLHDLQIDDLAFGVKVGSGSICSDLHFYDVASDNCRDAWFLASCEDSLFERLALAANHDEPNNTDHTFYLEREVRDCVFNDCKLGGGQGWALHIFDETADYTGRLTFNRLEIDVRDANYPLLVCGNVSHIDFNDIAIFANNATVYKCCCWFYSADNLTFDGIEAGGCNTLAFAPYDWATYTGTVFKNGTFEGTYLLRGEGAPPANAVAGITFQNVSLI